VNPSINGEDVANPSRTSEDEVSPSRTSEDEVNPSRNDENEVNPSRNDENEVTVEDEIKKLTKQLHTDHYIHQLRPSPIHIVASSCVRCV